MRVEKVHFEWRINSDEDDDEDGLEDDDHAKTMFQINFS